MKLDLRFFKRRNQYVMLLIRQTSTTGSKIPSLVRKGNISLNLELRTVHVHLN